MKNALIAAVVAALVAAASGTAATLVITSKNIKNGTIQTIDISAKAKRALRGQRGPIGPRGLQGLVGATGPIGPAGPGLSGLHFVWAHAPVAPNSGGSVVAECDPGEVVISGGGSTTSTWVYASVPAGTHGWLSGIYNDSPDPATVEAVALCGRMTG
jgi:hypothetical protein